METMDEFHSLKDALNNLMLAKVGNDYGFNMKHISSLYVDYASQSSTSYTIFTEILAEAFEIVEHFDIWDQKEDVFYWLGEERVDKLRGENSNSVDIGVTVILDDRISLKKGDIPCTTLTGDEGEVEIYLSSIDSGLIVYYLEDYGYDATCYVKGLQEILPFSNKGEKK